MNTPTKPSFRPKDESFVTPTKRAREETVESAFYESPTKRQLTFDPNSGLRIKPVNEALMRTRAARNAEKAQFANELDEILELEDDPCKQERLNEIIRGLRDEDDVRLPIAFEVIVWRLYEGDGY